MTAASARVLLVGYEDQDNLGLRYLASNLRRAGHVPLLVAIDGGPAGVVAAARSFAPDIIGCSLIFQYLVPEFAAVLRALRAEGIRAHTTMGGHYPSFEPAALLDALPELDSVVRFEGEDTIVELADRIARGEAWRGLAGMAWRGDDGAVLGPPRIGRGDLDEYPWPDREDIAYERQALPIASVLGGRGCPWKCSFCSIITFYEGNGTKGRRRRDPRRIVDEVEHLHRERGVRIILWQDDDFLSGGRKGVEWAHAIAGETIRRGLHQTMRWKISCRSDEVVAPGVLEPLVEAGLTHVYMGVEAGEEENLRNLNKLLKPSVHLRAGDVLRRLGLSFDFGFMLLEPWSTASTVAKNLTFLRAFVGDGAAPVTLCRTLPYAGTPILERLVAEGRMTSTSDLRADYRFEDARLDGFYEWMLATFNERTSSPTGMANLLRLAMFESHLTLPGWSADPELRGRVRRLVALSNRIVLDTLEIALEHVMATGAVVGDRTLAELSTLCSAEDARLRRDLSSVMRHHAAPSAPVHLMR